MELSSIHINMKFLLVLSGFFHVLYSMDVTLELVSRYKSLSTWDKMKLLRQSDDARAASIVANVPMHLEHQEFIVRMVVGSESYSLREMVFDTGSSWTWIKTDDGENYWDYSDSSTLQLMNCSDTLCPLVPGSSCTSSNCRYKMDYLDTSSVQGKCGKDILGFRSPRLNFSMVFGLGQVWKFHEEFEGVLGFGRASTSFVQQLKIKKFGYCLASNARSSLFLGNAANFSMTTIIPPQSTPFVDSYYRNAHYTAGILGVSMYGMYMQVPNNNNMLIFDSGTSSTYLADPLYTQVEEAFNAAFFNFKRHENPLCYDYGQISTSLTLTFHFEGGNMRIQPQNYIVTREDTSEMCVGIHKLANRGDGLIALLGNHMQTNYMVVHDLEKAQTSFAPANCPS